MTETEKVNTEKTDIDVPSPEIVKKTPLVSYLAVIIMALAAFAVGGLYGAPMMGTEKTNTNTEYVTLWNNTTVEVPMNQTVWVNTTLPAPVFNGTLTANATVESIVDVMVLNATDNMTVAVVRDANNATAALPYIGNVTLVVGQQISVSDWKIVI
jgi:hypothetical protein